MKITMIGTSGSGKTVFSAGIYATFIKKDFQGFTLFPQGDGMADQVMAANKFSSDYKLLAKFKWPSSTNNFSQFIFDLKYDSETIAPLEWIDYRGGFLDNPEINNDEARKLYTNISTSNAVILFADAHRLTQSDSVEQAAFESGVETIIQIMRGFANIYPGQQLSFLIALTKCDAVPEKWRGVEYSYQPLVEYGRKAFDQLCKMCKHESKWRGGILPISTMGEGTVNEANEIIKFLSPFNVEHALAYCISNALRAEQTELIEKLTDSVTTQNQLENDNWGIKGLTRRTLNYAFNFEDEKEKINQIRNNVMEELSTLKRLNAPLEKLADVAMKRVSLLI